MILFFWPCRLQVTEHYSMYSKSLLYFQQRLWYQIQDDDEDHYDQK